MSNDKLFELYVLLNTLEALEKTKGKITFQKALHITEMAYRHRRRMRRLVNRRFSPICRYCRRHERKNPNNGYRRLCKTR